MGPRFNTEVILTSFPKETSYKMIDLPFVNAEITSLEGNTKLDPLSSDFSSCSLSILTIIANIILIPRQIVSGFTIKHY